MAWKMLLLVSLVTLHVAARPAQDALVCEPNSIFKIKCNLCHCAFDGSDFDCSMNYCPENEHNSDTGNHLTPDNETVQNVDNEPAENVEPPPEEGVLDSAEARNDKAQDAYDARNEMDDLYSEEKALLVQLQQVEDQLRFQKAMDEMQTEFDRQQSMKSKQNGFDGVDRYSSNDDLNTAFYH